LASASQSGADSFWQEKADKQIKTAPAAAPANQATMVVTLYDGTHQPIEGKDFL